jgi:hypothetical protein
MKKINLLGAALAAAACFVSQAAWAGGGGLFIQVTTTITPTTGGYSWDYKVFNDSEEQTVDRFLLPELHSGDLIVDPSHVFPLGWTISEISASQATSMGFVLPTIYSNAAVGAYLEVNGNGNVIPAGFYSQSAAATVDFDFFSNLGGSTGAYFDFHSSDGQPNQLVDPPIPAPEPGSIALLAIGSLGLFALRRRNRA